MTGAVRDGRCWNDDLLKPAREQLILKWETIQDWLHIQDGSLARDTRTIFDKWCGEIAGRSFLRGTNALLPQIFVW